MAESVVSFVAEKVYNLLKEEAILLHGVDEQVQSLETELRQMQAFVRAAESKATEDDNIASFLRDVREAAYDVEDIVDTYILRMHRQRQRRGFRGFVKRYGCILQECARRHRTGMQIEKMKTRLQKISEKRNRYGIPDVTSGTQGTVSQVDMFMQEQRALAIEREMNVMVGFDDDMEKIVGTLLGIDQKPQRCVISVVGMGGAGKSTLARRICNRTDVISSFHGCPLVTVSQTLNLRRIFEDIAVKFSKLDKEAIQKLGERDLKEEASKSLQGRRYLIVLDDIWETEVWPLIRPHLPDESNGSRVIITTRSMNVAKLADPSMEPHQLRLLREDESWELFTKIVFPGRHDQDAEEVCTGELRDLGKKILKTCGGLPLAVVLMAGLLSTREKSPIAWHDAVRGLSWEEVPGGRVFSKVLALSYTDLPHHLKPCFLYLSLFPEDFEIDAPKLIWLWVAEGFVPDQIGGQQQQQQSNYRTMEETAEGWLEDLVRRCLVQVAERLPSGTLLACRMHDVLRDLSIKEAEKANFFESWQQQVASTVSSPSVTARRLVLLNRGPEGERCTSQEFSAPKLRTLLNFSTEGLSSLQFLTSSKLLRVLDLEGSNCRKLPKAIGDLIHLRYLGLSDCEDLESIPSSVGNLQNLQTFIVARTPNLEEVPDSLWGIGTLRHVLADEKIEPRINVGGGSSLQLLVNLQTLGNVRAGSWIESSLATMTRLRMLRIVGISEAHQQALSNSLDCLVHLFYLSLVAKEEEEAPEEDSETPARALLPRKVLALPNHRRLQILELKGTLVDDPVYGSDEMPPNLSVLFLDSTGLRQDPLLLLEKSQYLKQLFLINAYEGEEASCSAGGFPQLEELDLINEPCLRRWTVADGAMPRLRRLKIRSCKQLEMLPDGLQHLKTLQTLEIESMPEEFVRRLRKDEGGEDWHKIQHIPYVDIRGW